MHKKNKCLVAYAVDTVTVEYCLKYSSYFTVKNLPQPLRQSSFFNISWSNLCDYPHDTGLLHSYHKATLYTRSFLSVPYVNSTDCLLMQSLGLIQHAVRSGAKGSSWLPSALDQASCC